MNYPVKKMNHTLFLILINWIIKIINKNEELFFLLVNERKIII